MKTKTIDGQGIFVEWEHVSREDMNGIPLGYKVKYNASDVNSSGIVAVDYNAKFTTLAGLIPISTYIIDVCAFTIAGAGPCLRTQSTTGISGKFLILTFGFLISPLSQNPTS